MPSPVMNDAPPFAVAPIQTLRIVLRSPSPFAPVMRMPSELKSTIDRPLMTESLVSRTKAPRVPAAFDPASMMTGVDPYPG